MKKLIGILILIIVFGAIFYAYSLKYDVLTAIKIFAIALPSAGIIYYALILITSGEKKFTHKELKVERGWFVHCHHDLYGGLSYYGPYSKQYAEKVKQYNSEKNEIIFDEINLLYLPYIKFKGKIYALWNETECSKIKDEDDEIKQKEEHPFYFTNENDLTGEDAFEDITKENMENLHKVYKKYIMNKSLTGDLSGWDNNKQDAVYVLLLWYYDGDGYFQNNFISVHKSYNKALKAKENNKELKNLKLLTAEQIAEKEDLDGSYKDPGFVEIQKHKL